jgi:hypothetical protein
MNQNIEVTSGEVAFTAELDFATSTWSSLTGRAEGAFPSSTHGQPEGEFPLTVHLDGKRYELYSDQTFAEVEGGLD